MHKYNYNFIAIAIEIPYKTITHIHNHSKITTLSRIEKSNYDLFEQDYIGKIVLDVLNKVDNNDLLNLQSISSINSYLNNKGINTSTNNDTCSNTNYSVLKLLDNKLIQ